MSRTSSSSRVADSSASVSSPHIAHNSVVNPTPLYFSGAVTGWLAKNLRIGTAAATEGLDTPPASDAAAPTAAAAAVAPRPAGSLSPGLEFTGAPPQQNELETEADGRKRRSRAASSSGRRDAAANVVPQGAKKHAKNAWQAAAAAQGSSGAGAGAGAGVGRGVGRAAAGRGGAAKALIGQQAERARSLALWVAAGVFAGWLGSGGWRSIALRLPPVRPFPPPLTLSPQHPPIPLPSVFHLHCAPNSGLHRCLTSNSTAPLPPLQLPQGLAGSSLLAAAPTTPLTAASAGLAATGAAGAASGCGTRAGGRAGRLGRPIA